MLMPPTSRPLLRPVPARWSGWRWVSAVEFAAGRPLPADWQEPWRAGSVVVELATDGLYHRDLKRYGPRSKDWGRCYRHRNDVYEESWQADPVHDAPLVWAEDVPKQERCPFYEQFWPVVRRTDRLGRIRQLLQRELGDWCSHCGDIGYLVVDHDHATGLIRGLLCRWCNGRADVNPEYEGYRATGGPAAHLALSYVGDRRRREELVAATLF